MEQPKRIRIALLCTQMILVAMILPSTGLALPRLKEEFGLTAVQQGGLVSIQYIGFTLAVLLGGTLFERFRKIRILSIGFGILGIAAIIFGGTINYWMTVIGVLLIGAFGSIAQNGITTLGTNLDIKNSEKNNAFIQLFFTVGAVLTPTLLLIFTIWLDQWRPTYYIVGVGCIVIALITMRYKEEAGDKNLNKDNYSVYVKALKTPSYLIAPIALFLYVGAEIGIWGFAPVFFENQGYGKISGIMASVLIWISMLIGRTISVRLLKKFDMILILIANGILATISLIFVIYSGQTASIIWISIAGFACSPFYPLLVNWMTRLTGETNSSALALTMAFGSMGAVVVGWVSGLVVDSYGARYVTAVPALSLILVILTLIVFRKRRAK